MIDYFYDIENKAICYYAEVQRIKYQLQKAINSRQTIFLIGNGGSWSTAIHIAEDLNRRGIKASALDSLPLISAISNDETYSDIFVRQLAVFAKQGDVLIALSVSGKSTNIVRAVLHARRQGLQVITLTGKSNPRLGSKFSISLDNGSCMLVEPIHFALLHWVVYQLKPCQK